MSAKDLATTFGNLNISGKSVTKKVMEFPADVCGGCGAKEHCGGGALLACSNCHQRCYCDVECQKAHWSEHKKGCGASGTEAGK